MAKTLIVVAVLALAGCKDKKPAADCAGALANAMQVSTEELKTQLNFDDAKIAAMRDASVERCKTDKWSDVVVQCYATAKTRKDVAGCDADMTDPQKQALSAAIAKAMGPGPASGSATAGSAPGSAPAGSAPPPGELPAECVAYRDIIEKLAACTNLPAEARTTLKATYDETSKTWTDIATMPAESKSAMADACKRNTDAVRTAAAPTCAW